MSHSEEKKLPESRFKYCPECAGELVRELIEGRRRLRCQTCGEIHYENPLPATAVVCRNEKGELLLVKRNEQPCVGQWCLPGGFIEMGETAREGALREFKEETGLKGKILRVIDVATRVDGYWGDVVLIGFEVEATGGTLNAMDDAEEAEYFPLDDDILYRCWNATTGNWTLIEVVSTESSSYSLEPSMIMDCNANIHITWRDKTDFDGAGSDNDIFYKYWNANTGNWTITEVISTESADLSQKPTIAVDIAGDVHIVWEQDIDPSPSVRFKIYYRRTYGTPNATTLAPIIPNPNGNGIIPLNWSVVGGATSYYLYRNVSFITTLDGLTPIATVAALARIRYPAALVPTRSPAAMVVLASTGASTNSPGSSALSQASRVAASMSTQAQVALSMPTR